MVSVEGGWETERERNSESSKGREQELFADKEQERRQVRGKKDQKTKIQCGYSWREFKLVMESGRET